MDGAGMYPTRDGQRFGTFTAFAAQDTDFITSSHKIQSPATVATDVDDVLATKGYVDTVAAGGTSFTSETIATGPFNFAYTLEQYNEVFGTSLERINGTIIEFTNTLRPRLALGATQFSATDHVSITSALDTYLEENTGDTYYSADLTLSLIHI